MKNVIGLTSRFQLRLAVFNYSASTRRVLPFQFYVHTAFVTARRNPEAKARSPFALNETRRGSAVGEKGEN